MAAKRGRSEDCVTLVESAQPLEQRLSKRCCGTQLFPAPGELTPHQLGSFLAQLSRSFNLDLSSPSLQAADLSAADWQCFAELNLLLQQHFPSLHGDALRSYHSFTRAPKQHLWSRYAMAHGVPQQLAHVPPATGSPRHLQLVAAVLGSVFSSYPEAAVTKLTVRLPPWMAGWAARWGCCVHDQMQLLILEAYPPSDPSSSRGPAEGPLRTLYVPMMQ